MASTLQTDFRPDSHRPPAASRDPGRWTLNRAGIVNVYQYGNETLHFGGGRLLLRGVNGSGKSTAMNMLLPFLLDGDTRRIDAAGEQSGVLRSWMLAGRDEPQPQGYLWLEMVKEGVHVTFGCGIRANRSTDQVATWWFITSRRPEIDLQLVEGRVPVSREELRTAIAPDPVFRHEQRSEYRAELRRRLFGGADIEQHLHLLHIVRNPRVGDRLDAELPQYLHDALPQLSDAALDDAAQPLEDLEEHRKNVSDLRTTAEALDAIEAVYRNYARTEVHRLTDRTLEAARASASVRRDEEKARAEHAQAIERQIELQAGKHDQEREVERLAGAISALQASEAYKSGAQLNDLRDHVDSLARSAATAATFLQGRRAATDRAAAAVRNARREADDDHAALYERLADLGSLASGCGLTARPPSAPPFSPSIESVDGLELAPSEGRAMDTAAADGALSRLRAAARQRLGDVETAREAVRAIEPAERAVRDAERALQDAQSEDEQARAALADARAAARTAVEEWQSAAADWITRLRRHHERHGVAGAPLPPDPGAVIDEIALGRSVSAPLQALAEPAIRHHEGGRARLDAALKGQLEVVSELEAQVAELAAKELPDPPVLAWQERRGLSLAELVDFAGHVELAARAGLEAALEASGLLAAEVHADGGLRLADGQLVIAPQAPGVEAPLGELLRADIADEPDAGPELRTVVARILQAISTDPNSGANTVVTIDGEFRTGSVRGKHTKSEAEHIGVGARRAALERRRAEVALALQQAKSARDSLAAEVEAAAAALAEARHLRQDVPSDRDLHTAFWRRNEAEERVEKTGQRLHERRTEAAIAEQRHAETVAHAHTTAARLSLPPVLDGLHRVGADLERIMADSREAQRELTRLARATRAWHEACDNWRAARADEKESEEHHASVSAELRAARERLATLDATIGVDYKSVLEKIDRHNALLTAARKRLQQAENEVAEIIQAVVAAEKDCESAAIERQRADEACAHVLDTLRRALAVPGLLDAAVGAAHGDAAVGAADTDRAVAAVDAAEASVTAAEPAVAFPTVEDTPAGARRLAEAVRASVPPPAEPPTTAEGVRQSIRNRRDSLGAGWDAEDRQPEEHRPLHVEVNGPLAQQTPLPAATRIVRRQLATMTSLLSAKQHQALRNLLQGLVAREVADKLHAAGELIARMNQRLSAITTSHGIGVSLRWRQRDDLDLDLAGTINLLAKPPDLRTADEDRTLSEALGRRIDDAHREDPGTPYRELIARVLDYREWHRMTILLQRPGRAPERLSRRTALSEGEKKIVSYLPLFAAVAASCDGLAAVAADAPRFVLLDDAFAKVSEDNHAKLFGLLVGLDLDFIATSERLWGTHDTVPELAITEVIRDADLQTIVLEHSRWEARRAEHA